MVEYNVPESGPGGTPVFSHPDNQYPVDQSSLLGNNMNIGDDWGVFRTFPNSNTGQTAAQGQDSFFRLDSNPGLLNGDPIITAGYGRDDDPNGTGPPIPPGPACYINPDLGLGWCHNNMSTTQQKSVGIHLSTVSDNHTARSEIAVGVSGGPMIAFDSGLVYGIVTHRSGGTCTKSCFNYGQNLSITPVYNAINNLVGINAQYVDPDHPKSGGDGSIFQPHANIQDAIDAATSGGYIILMPGTHAVSGIDLKNKNLTFFSPFKETTVLIHGGNLVISSNRTLRFEGNAAYRFQSGRSVINNGNLQINGSENNQIIFTAENDYSSWGGFTFNANSGGIVQYAVIDRVSGFGNAAVSIQGNASPVIQYSIIKPLPGGYTFGISAQSGIGYMNPKIYKSYIESNSAPAIYAGGNNAYISIHDSDIIQLSSHPAVHAAGNAIIASWIAATIYDGKNRISGGRLLSTGSGVVLFGELNASKAQNHFCDSGSAVLEVNSSGTIFAAYNYWPNGLAPTQINNGGAIHYSNNLGSSECDAPYLTMTPDLFSYPKGGINSPALKTEHQAPESYGILFDEILNNINNNDIDHAIEKLLTIVSDDILPYSLSALQIAVYLKRTRNIPLDVNIISGSAAGTKHEDIRISAEYLLASTELMEGSIDAALSRYIRLSQEFIGTGTAFYAKLNRFYVYLELGRINEAANIYNELKQYDYPYDWVQHAALNLLDSQRNYVITEYSNKNEQETADAGISVLVYPNPFNPNTTIRYTIPADNPVKIQIVDILGREVYQRVEHNRQAGSHEVVFEASHLASGLYFYMISSGSLHKTGSILLLK
ncbi:MAG: T9SS type A sorting domain-containing protein [Cyclonatronaceae bacterium]